MSVLSLFSKQYKNPLYAVFVIILVLNGCTTKEKAKLDILPPKAKKIQKQLTIHGDTRIDNYFWLRERENPEVIEYLKAENEYKDAMLKHSEKLQEKLFHEIVARIKQTDMSVPYKENGYYYYTRYETGLEHPIYCRKQDSLKAKEEIMLNVNEMAKRHDFYQVTGIKVSEDNRFLAFGVDTVSRRQYTLRFKNLKTGEMLLDAIPNTTGNAAWANDNRTVFYAANDTTLRPYKIMKHILGSTSAEDVELFHEIDNTFNTHVYKSKSKAYIFINSSSTLSTEFRFLDADDPSGEFKIFNLRKKDCEYMIEHFEDKFYIVTNWNAKNFRLMETSVDRTTDTHWKEVIPHRSDVLMEDIEVFKDYLVAGERKNGLRQIRVIDQGNKSEHYLDFGEAAYMVYTSVNPEFDTELLRYGYSSLTTPNSTFDYNLRTKEKTLLKQEEVLGGFDPQDYLTERLYATADDGTKIPISLVYRKGLAKDGNHPLLLYGYGSYGASVDASFRSDRLSLLDRGFVFAIAHIRGGQEMGRQWYEDGKMLKKKNTFTDFIDCAEYLIAEKYTNPDNLFAIGGSAGGLLIGAVVNMRPDLFKGVIAAVPWVDVVTTMLDESIPLTTAEYDEWGNPNQKEYYDYMLLYSPYDNVRAQNYPNIFVTTGLHDSQVQYWEPAKWVAKLRDLKTDSNRLVLHTDMKAGHGGKAGRFERYKLTAMEYAFLPDLVGIRN